ALAARRTAIISIVAAGVLVVLKLGVGAITGSLGLISTGIESSGDLVAATLTFFVIRLGGRPADTEHPYGHRRAENLGALGEAGIIAGTAVRLLLENANVLMDRTPAEARLAAERAIAALGADIELTRLRLRESAGRYFADVVVTVPPAQAVVEGHQAANMIESALEAALPGSDVVVHVEPRRSGLRLRERVLAIALEEPAVMEAHDIAIFQRDGALDVSMHLKF